MKIKRVNWGIFFALLLGMLWLSASEVCMSKVTVREQANREFATIQQRLGEDYMTFPSGNLLVPQWMDLQLRGTDIVGAFTPVFGAQQYEIAYNTVASETGAVLFLATANTHFSQAFNNLPLQDGGFESGTLSAWNPDTYEISYWEAVTAARRRGVYGARATIASYLELQLRTGPALGRGYLIPTLPNTPHASSFYGYLVNSPGTGTPFFRAGLSSSMLFWNSVPAVIGSSTGTSPITAPVGTWFNVAETATSPAGTVYVSLVIVAGNGNEAASFSAYVDDVSLASLPASSMVYFAVRAIQSDGTATPYSSWLHPVQVSKTLGAGTTEEIITHQSAGFSPSEGIQISNLGLATTGWDYPVEPWMYASSTTFAVVGDVTARYHAGTKLRLRQGGAWKYFEVASSSYSAPTTTVTVTSPNSDTIANAAITDNYYSYAALPQGWAWLSDSLAVPIARQVIAGDGLTGGGALSSDVTLNVVGGTGIYVSANEVALGSSVLAGWFSADETWTYASATTFTVSGDRTAKYQTGTKLKLTQTTDKYFYVVSSSHAAGTTTVTVTAGSDYSLANAAITSPYYSYSENPQGFPSWFNYSPTWGGWDTNPTAICRFKVAGRTCHVWIHVTTPTASNATTKTVTGPITSANISNATWIAPCIYYENNDWGYQWYGWGSAEISTNSTTISCFVNTTHYLTWSATGNAGVRFQLQYEI